MYRTGTKVNIPVGPVSFPGIVLGPAELTMVPLRNGGQARAYFAPVLTLRTANPDGENAGNDPYLRVTPENLTFATMRFDEVVGLDIDEGGHLLDIQTLEKTRAEQLAARAALFTSNSAPVAVESAVTE
jgi:hypothetical protein